MEFRGSSLYASLNAHELKVFKLASSQSNFFKELSPRDDLWSLLFLILDFITGNLPWRHCKHDRVLNFTCLITIFQDAVYAIKLEHWGMVHHFTVFLT